MKAKQKLFFSGIIMLLMGLYGHRSIAQTANSFTLDDGRIMEGTLEFYPTVLNYVVGLQNNAPGNPYVYVVSHYMDSDWWQTDRCGDISSCPEVMASQFEEIRSNGFNTLRLMDLSLRASECSGNTIKDHSKCVDRLVCQPDMHLTDAQFNPIYDATTKLPIAANLEHHFTLIEQVLNLADDADLKVILLAGHQGITEISDQYEDYLTRLVARPAIAHHDALLAIDLVNEPTNSQCRGTYTKSDVAGFFCDWYQAAKSTPNGPLVTVGFVPEGHQVFDPGVMTADFLSLHSYPKHSKELRDPLNPNRNYTAEGKVLADIFWFSANADLPWMVGETGFSAEEYNTTPSPYVDGNYDHQRSFAKKGLALTKDCNGIGYSWWQFQDVDWSDDFDKVTSNPLLNSRGNYYSAFADDNPLENVTFGGTTYSYYNSPKPMTEEFENFISPSNYPPVVNESNCVTPTNYTSIHDPSTLDPYTITGRVVTQDGIPLSNAFIMWKIPDWSFKWTYTDVNGLFSIKDEEQIVQVAFSSPGFSALTFHSADISYSGKIGTIQPVGDILLTRDFARESSKTVSGTITDRHLIAAEQTIDVSNLVVETTGSMLLQAGNRIFIDQAFEAKLGSRFFATIHDSELICGTNPSGAKSSLVVPVFNVSQELDFLQAYPNPSRDKCVIKSNDQPIGEVILFNATGMEVQKSDGLQQSELIINVSNLPSGIYFIKAQLGQAYHTTNLIVETTY